jgi:tetratricopeptide (TPR) repeat protein
MNRHSVSVALAAWFSMCALAWAVDAVKKTDGTTINGEISSVSKTEVVIQEKSIPVNEVEYCIYDSEPAAVKNARLAVVGGRYNEALETLSRLQAGDVTEKEVVQDVEFFRAYSTARMALAGEGDVLAAGKDMVGFQTKHADSYHYFKAVETIGDLLTAAGRFANAETYYAQLKTAPWPAYRLRAGVAVGRSLLAQNKPQEAMKAFQEVLADKSEGEAVEEQRQAAVLGLARGKADSGQHAEAIKEIENIIVKANPEQVGLMAQAYNTLGTALRKSGDGKGALLAFLHVDVLYFSDGNAHAEALANLATLWTEAHQTERAAQSRQLLMERYKNSPWAAAMK